MSEASTQPQPTPVRRKQPRQQNRNSMQKAYMSESDMGAVDAYHHGMTPQTPEKTGYASPSTHNTGRAASAKQRNNNPKNNKSAKQKTAGTSTSPEPDHHHYPKNATPQRAASAGLKGPSSAFAGATFHASPAPSALPMPSFFSKGSTSPSATPRDAPAVVQQPSPPATDTDAPTPYRPPPAVKSSESPLDFMFRAHRQEKEQQFGGARVQNPTSSTPPTFSPFAAIAQATSSSQNRPVPARRVSHGISSDELDGTAGQPVGPAFSTPYQDRIKAAKANHAYGSPNGSQHAQQQHPQQPQHPAASQANDPTQALKNFLFGGNNRPSPNQPASNAAFPHPNSYGPNAPSPARHDEFTHGGYRGNNIQAMENDLRRILKIDKTVDSSPVERRLFK